MRISQLLKLCAQLKPVVMDTNMLGHLENILIVNISLIRVLRICLKNPVKSLKPDATPVKEDYLTNSAKNEGHKKNT